MSDAPEQGGLPPSLNFLKWLVIVLTLTMIGGVITVVGLLVTRMPQTFAPAAPAPALPASALPAALTLPEGTTARAVTFGDAWIALVTDDDRVLVYGQDGTFLHALDLLPAP